MPSEPLTFRRPTPKDAADFARINNHPEVLPNLMQVPYGNEERWRQMLAGNDEPGKLVLMLVAERAGRIVGNAGLHPVENSIRRRHVASLGIAVAPDAQGQGVGKALLGALCDYADNWGQILRIELSVFCGNEPAIRLYRGAGFEHEGT